MEIIDSKRNTFKGRLYHLYCRGVRKTNIFHDNMDYLRFMSLLNNCVKMKSKPLSIVLRKISIEEMSKYQKCKDDMTNILIYTLMPNHFHILTKEINDNKIQKLMQKVLNSYAKYYNKKYGTSGRLFEREFSFREIKDEYDLLNIVDYIYKNPLKLLNNKYKHIDIVNNTRKITKKEERFLKNYPYKYIEKDTYNIQC